MEIEAAARRYLLSKYAITNLVERRVYKFTLPTALEGTGDTAIVVRRRGGWAAPGWGSQEYPLLVIDCFADHSRPVKDLPPSIDDREERAMQLYREVDRVLHLPEGVTMWWPDENGLRILGCRRGSEPLDPVEVDGVAMVRVTYDVKTFH